MAVEVVPTVPASVGTGPLSGQTGMVRAFDPVLPTCSSVSDFASLVTVCGALHMRPATTHPSACAPDGWASPSRRYATVQLTGDVVAVQIAVGLTAFLLLWQTILLAVAARALHVLNNDYRYAVSRNRYSCSENIRRMLALC